MNLPERRDLLTKTCLRVWSRALLTGFYTWTKAEDGKALLICLEN